MDDEQAVYDLLVNFEYDKAEQLAEEKGVNFKKILKQFMNDERELLEQERKQHGR